MDVSKILDELRQEREQLEEAILSLDRSAEIVVGRRLARAPRASTVDQVLLAQEQKPLDAGIGCRCGISACGENAHDGGAADQIPV
jgi:hypothetical protein